MGLIRAEKPESKTNASGSMRILLASSEVHPYSKTGGLGDMAGAMGKALARAGHKVAIVTPLYRGILAQFPDVRRVDWVFDLPMGGARAQGGLYKVQSSKGLTVYFVDQRSYFDRPGIYMDGSADYADNAERFIFFSKCVAHLARYLPLQPQFIHVNDWQTGLVPLLIHRQ